MTQTFTMPLQKLLQGAAGMLLLTASACSAQKKMADSFEVQAKVWSKDEAKQVHYSDWQNFKTITVDRLKGFKSITVATDRYGGNNGQQMTATGFYHTEQLNGRWWVVDPAGHPVVVNAVNSIRPGKSASNESAMLQQFGSLANWMATTVTSLRELGFNMAGSWSDTATIIAYNAAHPAEPIGYTTQLNLLSGYASFAKKQNSARKGSSVLSFILDEAFSAYCMEQAAKISRLKADANLLGHFSDNELPFTTNELDAWLAESDYNTKAWDQLAKTAAAENINLAVISKEQKELLLGWLAGEYYKVVSQAIRQFDPNHLYIGSRLHASAKHNAAIFKAGEPYVDIWSINYYGYWQPKAEHIANWAAWTTKPFFITEFYTKAEETGMSNTSGAGWIVKTQANRGEHYQNFCLALLQAKNCVGWHWFRYQDNDPADASADASNKDSNKGLVNTRYEVYAPLAEKMKQLNDNKYAFIKYFDGQQ